MIIIAMLVLPLSVYANGYLSNIAGVTILKISNTSALALGVQFQEFGGGDRKINDMFTEDTIFPFTAGTGIADSDCMQIWDSAAGTYAQYFFGDESLGYEKFWYLDGDDSEPTEDILSLGSFVWYMPKVAAERYIVLSGEVRTESFSFNLSRGVTHALAYPFPAPISLFDIVDGGTIDWMNSGLVGGLSPMSADRLQVWVNSVGSSGGYNSYYFYEVPEIYWDTLSEEELELWNRKWFTLSDNWPTDPIPVGSGFWLQLKPSDGDCSITFPAVIN